MYLDGSSHLDLDLEKGHKIGHLMVHVFPVALQCLVSETSTSGRLAPHHAHHGPRLNQILEGQEHPLR